jgi:hypothetical protein
MMYPRRYISQAHQYFKVQEDRFVVRLVYLNPQWTKAALFVFIYLVHSLELVNQSFRNRKLGR